MCNNSSIVHDAMILDLFQGSWEALYRDFYQSDLAPQSKRLSLIEVLLVRPRTAGAFPDVQSAAFAQDPYDGHFRHGGDQRCQEQVGLGNMNQAGTSGKRHEPRLID